MLFRSPQESPFLHDPHSVSTYSAVSTARPLDAEPFFFNDDSLTVLLCEQHASLQSENFFILTLTLIAVGRNIWEDNSGPPTFPTQVSGTSNHGPMTPQPQQGESSHSQLASQAYQHTGILVPEYPVPLNNDIELEMGQDSNLRCPKCRKTFSSTGVRNRHWDDKHSAPRECPHPGCQTMLIGMRKLIYHLSKHHEEGKMRRQAP